VRSIFPIDSPDSSTIATACLDYTVKLWRGRSHYRVGARYVVPLHGLCTPSIVRTDI